MNKLTLIIIIVGLLLIGLFAIGLIYFNAESNSGSISGNVSRSSNGSLVISNVSESENTVVLLFNRKSTPLFPYAYSKLYKSLARIETFSGYNKKIYKTKEYSAT